MACSAESFVPLKVPSYCSTFNCDYHAVLRVATSAVSYANDNFVSKYLVINLALLALWQTAILLIDPCGQLLELSKSNLAL